MYGEEYTIVYDWMCLLIISYNCSKQFGHLLIVEKVINCLRWGQRNDPVCLNLTEWGKGLALVLSAKFCGFSGTGISSSSSCLLFLFKIKIWFCVYLAKKILFWKREIFFLNVRGIVVYLGRVLGPEGAALWSDWVAGNFVGVLFNSCKKEYGRLIRVAYIPCMGFREPLKGARGFEAVAGEFPDCWELGAVVPWETDGFWGLLEPLLILE